ncbi:MAG: DUF1853 domain-containing protein, partial [Psychrobacter sp.]
PIHEWCDKRDKAALATIDTTSLRAAHYIEWFTKRDFYDRYGRCQPPLTYPDTPNLRTGLYFEGERLIVIYPRQLSQIKE